MFKLAVSFGFWRTFFPKIDPRVWLAPRSQLSMEFELNRMADCYQNRYIVYYAQDRSRGTVNRLILTETMTTV